MDLKGHHPLFGDDISVRIAGIDTPEIKGKCSQEKKLAQEAKVVVEKILKKARKIKLKNVRRGKYFRIVADVGRETGCCRSPDKKGVGGSL
ncbi:MAG: hypothetical protein D3909_19415 [Candidatus Electrothrix sp. ATG1]|nr:hypothetical protein [Candidatus Electrothrix sp. ATG1]